MQTSTGKLRAIDLNNMGAGPVTLRTVGNLPPDNQSQWHLYPADGCWYTYEGKGGNTSTRFSRRRQIRSRKRGRSSTVQIGGPTLPSQLRKRSRVARFIAQGFSMSGRSDVSPGSPANATRSRSLSLDGAAGVNATGPALRVFLASREAASHPAYAFWAYVRAVRSRVCQLNKRPML